MERSLQGKGVQITLEADPIFKRHEFKYISSFKIYLKI